MNEPAQHTRDEHASYYGNLARISATLLAGLAALLTFLLIVGIQERVSGFTTELYAAVVLLGISLILYVAGNGPRPFPSAVRGLRILHQLAFVASVVAVVWFVISYAQLVLDSKPAQPQSGGQAPAQQGAPQAQASGQPQGLAPGETAEQHAAETQQQPAAQPR